MDDAVVVHVLEGLANQAGYLESVFFGQWPHRLEQVRQGATFQVLSDDVRPALIFDGNEFEDERMIQLEANSLFPLETRKEVGVAFIFHMRQLYGDDLIGVLLVLKIG